METIISKYLVINNYNIFWNINGVYITVYPCKSTDSLGVYFENIENIEKFSKNKIPICYLSIGRYEFELKYGSSIKEEYLTLHIMKSNDKLLFINVMENIIISNLIKLIYYRNIYDKNIKENTKIYIDTLLSNSDIRSIVNIIDVLDD